MFLQKGKKQLFNKLSLINKSIVLDTGTGTGSHLELLHAHKVYGIDVAHKMLKKSQVRSLENVFLSNQNAENTNFKNDFFDVVIISHVLSVTENPEELLKESYRVLKPNGKLFILNHNTTKGLSRFIDRIFNSISFAFNYSSYFCIDDLETLQLFKKVNEESVFMNNYITIQQYRK